VLYVPQLETNLLSVGRLIQKGYNVAFSALSCSVTTKDSFEILRAQYNHGIYQVNLNYGQPQPPTMQIHQVHTAITKPLPMQTWHRRLGHLNEADISRLATESADDIKIDPATTDSICIPCLQGKQHVNINRQPAQRATQLGSKIHSNLCGPIGTPSHSNYRYYIIYVDDWSRYIWVYFLKTKMADEISARFREFQALLETQCRDARIQ